MRKILFGIIVGLFCSAWLIGQGPSVDLLIQGGTVMDGSGSEPITADIGIKGDRIEFGDVPHLAREELRNRDAAGKTDRHADEQEARAAHDDHACD